MQVTTNPESPTRGLYFEWDTAQDTREERNARWDEIDRWIDRRFGHDNRSAGGRVLSPWLYAVGLRFEQYDRMPVVRTI